MPVLVFVGVSGSGKTTVGELTAERLNVDFLDVGLAAAVRRIGLARDRPLLAINPRSQLRVLMEERRPLYESVATITVSTDDRTPEEVADAVLARVALP